MSITLNEAKIRREALKIAIEAMKRATSQHILKLGRLDATIARLETPPKARRAANSPTDKILAETVSVLRAAGGAPVKAQTLLQRLRDRGLRIEGKRPEALLSGIIWRTSETNGILRLTVGGYVLAKAA